MAELRIGDKVTTLATPHMHALHASNSPAATMRVCQKSAALSWRPNIWDLCRC